MQRQEVDDTRVQKFLCGSLEMTVAFHEPSLWSSDMSAATVFPVFTFLGSLWRNQFTKERTLSRVRDITENYEKFWDLRLFWRTKGTNPPLSNAAWSRFACSVWALLKTSFIACPMEMWCMSNSCASFRHCVAFPDPGPPVSKTSSGNRKRKNCFWGPTDDEYHWLPHGLDGSEVQNKVISVL